MDGLGPILPSLPICFDERINRIGLGNRSNGYSWHGQPGNAAALVTRLRRDSWEVIPSSYVNDARRRFALKPVRQYSEQVQCRRPPASG
jgi:hypothetical protein